MFSSEQFCGRGERKSSITYLVYFVSQYDRSFFYQVLNHYINFVKPAYEEFCMPTKKFADVIIPRGADNQIAIELISHHITDLLTIPQSQRRCLFST